MMFLRKTTIYCLFFLAIGLHAACKTSKNLPAPKLLGYFHPVPVPDTIHIEIALDSDVKADTIPNSVFFTNIPNPFLEQIDYLADSAEAVVLSRMQIPINEHITAYWVEIRQAWFQHHSLFIYNLDSKQFIDRITVAEWYGGDGGQILVGSWVFDYDHDGQKDILRQEIQHSMVLEGEEAVEHKETAVSLYSWQKNHFMETMLPDTEAVMRQYPIRSFW